MPAGLPGRRQHRRCGGLFAILHVAHKLIQTQALGMREDPMTPFGTWLDEIGLGHYDDVFVSNGIDFDVIRSLSDADLRELGLTLGDRKRLLQAVARLDQQPTFLTGTPVVEPATAASGSLGEDAVSHGGERRQLTV